MAFPTTGVLDNFNRADEGPPPSASWTTLLNGHKVSTNTCIPTNDTSTCISQYNVSTYGPASECYVSIPTVVGSTITNEFSVGIRNPSSASADRYYCAGAHVSGANNDVARLYKRVSSVTTQLGTDISLSADWANGDSIGISGIATVLTAYRNNSSVGTRTDSDITAAGYLILHNTAGTTAHYVFDNFGGGTFVGSPWYIYAQN